MMKFLLLMPLICVGLWGCPSKTVSNACDGWSKLTPSLDTSVTILKTDRPFANQVAAHNRHGSNQGCWK